MLFNTYEVTCNIPFQDFGSILNVINLLLKYINYKEFSKAL